MSNTLLCLTKPLAFCSQDGVNNLSYNDSVTKNTFASDLTENVQGFTLTDNICLNADSIPKQNVSRKREASYSLVECVKRQNSLQNNFMNVPCKFECDSKKYDCMKQSELCGLPITVNIKDIKSNISCIDSLDGSICDSGIDILSKSSSPCHNIDNTSGPEEGTDENARNMDIDTADPSCNMLQLSNDQPLESTGAIHKDLCSLHLTDEKIINFVGEVKPPLSKSLFKHVCPTINFASEEETVGAMPEHILPLLKWKLSTITPVLIREIVLKCGFSLLDVNTTEDWLGTWGKHMKCVSFKRFKSFQKVNHYPGSFHLGRKDKLWENYKQMRTRHGSDVFNFFPDTFHLPNDLKSLKDAWESEDNKCWIIKPPASARGTGVRVIYKWSQVPKSRPAIVQRYLSDPYLINGTKFDLRIYVLISSIEPLRIYVFENGLVRFASKKYSLSSKSFKNRYVHLTNYSINRKSSSYTRNDDETSCQGHKWTLKAFWSYMLNSGIDVKIIQDAITDMILKTILCCEGPLCRLMKSYAKSTYNCYELFGFDIMLDRNLRPWLLEVNISPSLHTRSSLDSCVKSHMVRDMLNMVGFQVPESNPESSNCDYGILSPVATRHRASRNRCLLDEERKKHSLYTFQHEKADILDKLTADDVRCLIESEDEFNRRGGFQRIFPSESSSKYFMYFEHIRYYNLLLDAWEKQYHTNRGKGIAILQDLCEKKFHLKNHIVRSSVPVPEKSVA